MTQEPISSKKTVAEFVGTFALIYVGVLAIYSSVALGSGDLTTIALAHGLTIGAIASATMMISGGQLNPAVTAGLLVARQIPVNQALANVGAQLLGGIVGGFAAFLSLGGAGPLELGTPALGTLASGEPVGVGRGILIEAILTFILVFVVFGTAVDPRFGVRLGGLAIGLTVTFDIMAGGPLTGAAMNPARWLGSAVAARAFPDPLVYWIGPLAGGILAGLLWRFVLLERARA